MIDYRLVMIGFGNVGQGMAQILRDQAAVLEERYGVRFTIVGICDLLKGNLCNPAGLDPAALLEAVQADGDLHRFTGFIYHGDVFSLVAESGCQAVVELSYTDLKTGEPALSHIKFALENGKHVVTTNKGPVALHYPELHRLAGANGVEIGVEGTVMSGTPALHLGAEVLPAAVITRIQGILNGTTNYILTQMEGGLGYQEALAQAQSLGYAEADPTGDVEGYDAAAKVVILGNLLLGESLTMADVDRSGITGLTPEDITRARAAGERWKLIGSLEKTGGQIAASVRPVRLPLAHPLASVRGATNAITFSTRVLGDITLVGPGAGRQETGYALISDLLSIHRKGLAAGSRD